MSRGESIRPHRTSQSLFQLDRFDGSELLAEGFLVVVAGSIQASTAQRLALVLGRRNIDTRGATLQEVPSGGPDSETPAFGARFFDRK